MKREIIFRGITTEPRKWTSSRWIYGYLVFENLILIDNEFELNEISDYCIEVNPSTVGQYTGLEDKNGMRIFEGDRVKAEHVGIGSVRWCSMTLKWEVDTEDAQIPLHFIPNCEIIGNIHEEK